MKRVSKLVEQLKREDIALKVIDAGGGLGIDYHAAAETPSASPAVKVRNMQRRSRRRWMVLKANCCLSRDGSLWRRRVR